MSKVENLEKGQMKNASLFSPEKNSGNEPSYMLLLNSLSDIFFSIYLIDLDENEFTEIKSQVFIRNVVGEKGNAAASLSRVLDPSIEKEAVILDCQSEAILAFHDLATIRDRLSGCNSLSIEYKGKISGWVRAFIMAAERNEEGTVTKIIYATRQINDEKEQEEKALLAVKRAEDAENGFKTLHRVVKSGMWSMNFQENGDLSSVFWSDEFRHMIGYKDENDFPNDMEAWTHLIYPEDWDQAYGMIEKVVFDKSGKSNYDVQFRLKTKNKGYRWFRATGDVYRTAEGNPVKFYGVFFDITDQKERDVLEREKELALENAESTARAMNIIREALGSGNWGMTFNQKGELESVSWSNEFRRMLGFSFPRDFPDVLESWTGRLHKDDRDRILTEYWKTVNDYTGHKNFDVEFRMLTKNEGYKWFHAAGRLSRREDGSPVRFYGLFMNIEKQKQSEIEINNQLKIVDALSHDYADVFIVDPLSDSSTPLKINSQMVVRNDRPRQSYINNWKFYIEKYVVEEDAPSLWNAVQSETVIENLRKKSEYTLNYKVHSNGVIHSFQVKFIYFDEKAESDNIIVAFRNVDDIVRDELEHRKILMTALEAAQKASRSKTVFLNNMSHDIRTPMNAIIGFSNLALNHADEPETVRNYLSKISTSSSHLLALINDILDMSRIESGKVTLEEKPNSLSAIMADLNTIVQSEFEAKQIDFYVDMVNVRDAFVICDKLRVNQILLNLLSNALKFTPAKGTVKVLVTQKEDTEEGYGNYEFSVRDTGIGMSRDFMGHIFEAFERERTSTVSGIQGTGLGMSITKNLVDMMGGTINVDSVQGKGSCFTVCLKLRTCDESDYTKRPKNASAQKTAEKDKGVNFSNKELFKDKKLLLVEDNELNQEIAKTVLEELGFKVDTVDDGTYAVEAIEKAGKGDYEAVLMDIQMPKMDGYEATRKIRSSECVLHDIPIVAMTANAFEEDRQNAVNAGMNDYVAKPFNVEDLTAVLRKIFVKDV